MRKFELQVLQGKKHFEIPTFADSPDVKKHFNVLKVQRFTDKRHCDLIYTQNFGPFIPFLLKTKRPYVMHMGGNPWLELKGGQLDRVAKALSRARLVTCVSEFLANQIRENIPNPKGTIMALPGGLWGMDHTKLGPQVSRFKEKTNYELSKPPTVIMSMGLKDDERLENKWRGIPIFLDAVKDVAKEHDVRFVCAGRGDYKFSKLEEWKEKYNFDFIRSHQLDDEKDLWPDLLQSADIFIHPGTYDCWPRVVAEAMITGLPCMTFDITGNAEVGFSVHRYGLDCEHLANDFDLFLSRDVGYRKVAGERCRKEALEKTEKHRGDYAALLLSLVGGSK